jgi:hypothetical protein
MMDFHSTEVLKKFFKLKYTLSFQLGYWDGFRAA